MTRDQMGGWVVAKKDTNPTKVISLSPAGCAGPEVKPRWAKNCCLKTACRPRRAQGKAQVGPKLLPKDSLPAAPGRSDSPGGPKLLPKHCLASAPGPS